MRSRERASGAIVLTASYEERFTGALLLDPEGANRPARLTLAITFERARSGAARGVLWVHDLIDDAALAGTVLVQPSRGELVYALATSDQRIRLAAHRRLLPRGPLAPLSLLAGDLFHDSERRAGEIALRFSVRDDLGRLLRSIRLTASTGAR